MRASLFLLAGILTCLFTAAGLALAGDFIMTLLALVGFVGWFIAGLLHEERQDPA